MTQKVLLNVYLAAAMSAYEFRVPHALLVGQVANLMASLLESQERLRFHAPSQAGLMYLDGERAGTLLEQDAWIGTLASDGELVDGSLLALV